jgi:hypothetical protein
MVTLPNWPKRSLKVSEPPVLSLSSTRCEFSYSVSKIKDVIAETSSLHLPLPTYSQETLSEEILGKMYAGTSLKPKYPIIKPNDLKEL